MKALDILNCTVFLSDGKACWSNKASLSFSWHSSLPSSLPIANLPSCQITLTHILDIWQHLRTSLWSSCVWFDRQLCQTHVLQWRLSFLLAALLSCLPSHHVCQQRSWGQGIICWRWAEFYCFGWCLPSMFLNRAFSPLPRPLLRMLSCNTCTCCMRFPFSWDS